MSVQPVLIDGQWRPAQASASFQACHPPTGEYLPDDYPVSSWPDCEAALQAATAAAVSCATLPSTNWRVS